LLAGISVDYIVRLEQGRARSPSVQVLTALARALRLSEQERRHLFVLSGQSPPANGHISAHITPSVQRLLDQMQGTPVGVFDAAWTLIAWNRLYAALLGDPSGISERERNIPWQHFTGQASRVSHTREQESCFEVAVVADLRAANARYPSDIGLRSLITDLRNISARFAELWASQVVGVHTMHSKTVHHPEIGPISLDCDVLTVPASDLRLVAYTTPANSRSIGQNVC
jgi:transcriptional regulator with XRE-family HTH domain